MNNNIYDEFEFEDDVIAHYGTPRHSGRYPWGSGENPYQRTDDFLSRNKKLQDEGLSEAEIAKSFGLTTTQLRAQLSLAKAERRADLVASVKSMKSDGYNNVQIAEKLGLKGESTVRSLLKEDSEIRMKMATKTADNLRDLVEEKGMLDVGIGTERHLGITDTKMKEALEVLRLEGYEVRNVRVPQATNPGKYTTMKVLTKPGTEYKDAYNFDEIGTVFEYTSRDGGDTLEPSFRYPASMDSKRLAIRYAEDGGKEKDGLVEIRPGVKDLSLGDSTYAQVRILVDGTHYIKGMAVYNDDLPEGVDVMFNTNKTKDKSKMEVLKKIKDDDPENPFGSAIKEHGGQSYYDDPNGEFTDPVTGHKQSLSLINKRSDEGDWNDWADTLPSQFLSKQPLSLIQKQLSLSIAERQDEFDEIMSLDNPTVKKAFLKDFADDCDAASVELKAAAIAGQKYKVILPVPSLGDNEIYDPSSENGSEVALIRYPHGGLFEIPVLKVNNANPEGKKYLGNNPTDAVGINATVAAQLSGADFDGDTVMIIPITRKVSIQHQPPLRQLKDFDPKVDYGGEIREIDGVKHYFRGDKEFKPMTDTQKQMGIISNLITDMTLKGATDDELARAVKHSMVVIDAEKHGLDYRQSEKDNGIAELKKKYQVHDDGKVGGASTLISSAKSVVRVDERKEGGLFTKDLKDKVNVLSEDDGIFENDRTGEILTRADIRTKYVDPNTGEKLYHNTNRTYKKVKYKDDNGKAAEASLIERDGKEYYWDKSRKQLREVTDEKVIEKRPTTVTSKMAEAKDAMELSSGTPKENLYAQYANKLKAMANQARLADLNTEELAYNPEAKRLYKDEVDSLDYKLNQAKLNAPKERHAQMLAASSYQSIFKENPNLTDEKKGKIRQAELTKARRRVGALRNEIEITDREWAAIQSGAVSKNRLGEIVRNSNKDKLRQLAMPRETKSYSTAKINRMKAMANSGYTTAEIAKALGVSSSTVLKYLKGKE